MIIDIYNSITLDLLDLSKSYKSHRFAWVIWSSAWAIWRACGNANVDANWSVENVPHLRRYLGAWDSVRVARSVSHEVAVVVHRHHRQTVWHGHRHAPLSWRNHHDYCDIVACSARCSYSGDAQSADPAVAPATMRCCLPASANCVDDDCCEPRSGRNCANGNAPLAKLCLRCGICNVERR